MTDDRVTQTVTLFVSQGEPGSQRPFARFEQTREIDWPGREHASITEVIRELADYAIEQIRTAEAVPVVAQEELDLPVAIETGGEENPTGGIIPPFITDRIPGHETDQP